MTESLLNKIVDDLYPRRESAARMDGVDVAGLDSSIIDKLTDHERMSIYECLQHKHKSKSSLKKMLKNCILYYEKLMEKSNGKDKKKNRRNAR